MGVIRPIRPRFNETGVGIGTADRGRIDPQNERGWSELKLVGNSVGKLSNWVRDLFGTPGQEGHPGGLP